MATPKPRIIPWLIEQVGRPEYPGLVWLNSKRTRFQIPWKHGRRQDWTREDIKIFEAWAVASGIYNPSKDRADPKKWKRNLRSALIQKEGIRMVESHSSDSANPCKIYEISNAAYGNDAASEQSLVSGFNPQFQKLNLGNPPCNVYNSTVAQLPPGNSMNLELSQGEAALVQELENVQQITPADFIPNAFEPYVPHIPVQEPESVDQILYGMLTNNTLETQYDVNIYYRGTLVKNTLVKNPRGFCITSRKQPNPANYLEDVILPIPHNVLDSEVASSITKLLENLEDGTLVEERDGSVCGKRQGKCKSYWTLAQFPNTNCPNEISKSDYTVFFTMQTFIRELIQFTEGTRRESPQYTVWICLGQQWPHNRPWKENLVMVEVTSVPMKLLHELSYAGGATSLRSDELKLEISKSLSISSSVDMLAVLKELEEMMDSDDAEQINLNDVDPQFQQLSLGNLPSNVHNTTVVQHPPGNPLELSQGEPFVPDIPAQEPENVDPILYGMLTNNALETQYDVNIYYRGTLVKNTLVKNTHGFCITSRQQTNPENYLEDVILPIPYNVADSGVASSITELLENLEDGTLVEKRDESICGKRKGKCKSYWSLTEFPNTSRPNEISKSGYTVFYTMQQFIRELIQFTEGTRRESPQYTIWICLGQEWPHDRPWKENFIMVKVTSVSMKMLHELSYCGGASSLRSDELNLEISKSLSISCPGDLLPLLKEWEGRMNSK
ncbi:interferon regulatory factor 3-like [Pelobates fuscus]|uniref:interferon regulatory factor 3-like n=1 Tax=Pelobates fuscus TaxID=191477 RepID=UPI002FE450F4